MGMRSASTMLYHAERPPKPIAAARPVPREVEGHREEPHNLYPNPNPNPPDPNNPTPNPNPNAALIQALIGRCLGWSAMLAGMRAYSGLRPMTTYIGVKVPISPPATSPSCACRSISRTLPEPLGAMPTNSMKLSTMFIMKVPQ